MFCLAAQLNCLCPTSSVFLDALEWPDTAVLLSVAAVMEAKLQHVSEWSCSGETTDLWAGQSEISALDSNQSHEPVLLCADETGCPMSMTFAHFLVVAASCTTIPVTNRYFAYHYAFFQFISVHEEIISYSFRYILLSRF